MPDNNVEIRFSTTADLTGADKTAKAVENVGRETESAGLKSKAARTAFRGFATEFPFLARLAQLALNPISALAAGVALAAGKLQDHFAKINAALSSRGAFADSTKLWQDQAKALQDAGLEAAAFERSLNGVVDVVRSASETTAMLTANLKAQSQAAQEVEEAQKQLALATANTEAEREAIEVRFADRRRTRLNKEADESISIKRRERQQVKEELERLLKEREQIEAQFAGMERPGLIQGRLQAAQANFAAAQQQRIQRERAFAETGDPNLRTALRSDRALEAQMLQNLQAQSQTAFEREDAFNQANERRLRNRQQLQAAKARDDALGQQIGQELLTTGVEKDTRATVAEFAGKTRVATAQQAIAQRAVEINQSALQQAGFQSADVLSSAVNDAIREVFVNGVEPAFRQKILDMADKLTKEMDEKIKSLRIP